MVDTGGIELKSEDVMWKEIAKQADVAIETADGKRVIQKTRK